MTFIPPLRQKLDCEPKLLPRFHARVVHQVWPYEMKEMVEWSWACVTLENSQVVEATRLIIFYMLLLSCLPIFTTRTIDATIYILLVYTRSTDDHRLTAIDYYVDCVYIPHGPSPLAVVWAWLYTQRVSHGLTCGRGSAPTHKTVIFTCCIAVDFHCCKAD